MRLLVSVRDVAEARLAAAAGVDFIDLKDPAAGALGGLPDATLRAIVAALRPGGFRPRTRSRSAALGLAGAGGFLVSATIGDLPPSEPARILARVGEVAACGVDLVKVGIDRGPGAVELLASLAAAGPAIVPVFIADAGLDAAAYAAALGLGFPAVMLDTAAKRRGSLLELMPAPALAAARGAAREAGMPFGAAGALQAADLPLLAALAPDFAGFRSAVCAGDRAGALEPARLATLMAAVRALGCGSPTVVGRSTASC